MSKDKPHRVRTAIAWLREHVDSRDVLAFTGVGLIAWGLGLDETTGRVAAGAGLFYLGVLHPLVSWRVLRRSDD